MSNPITKAIIVLQAMFLVGKTSGWLDWSWLWIVSPIWISQGIVFAVIAIAIIVGILVGDES